MKAPPGAARKSQRLGGLPSIEDGKGGVNATRLRAIRPNMALMCPAATAVLSVLLGAVPLTPALASGSRPSAGTSAPLRSTRPARQATVGPPVDLRATAAAACSRRDAEEGGWAVKSSLGGSRTTGDAGRAIRQHL